MRALAVARGLASSAGEDLAAAWFGPAEAVSPGELVAAGVTRAWAIGSAELPGYAPLAWARALAALAADSSADPSAGPLGTSGASGWLSAVVAAATDHGNEVLAHLGAITGLPMAANCVSAVRIAPGECRLVRQRWAGSLLEDAVLAAPAALLTVATDAVPADAVRPARHAVLAGPAILPQAGVRRRERAAVRSGSRSTSPSWPSVTWPCWPPSRRTGAPASRWPAPGS